MDFLKELNPKQREAVLAECGPVLVLAGPGSGKTRVLTYRIAYLVRARDVAPWHIMAVTFTNKAAREMKERLGPLGHDAPRQPPLLSAAQLGALTIGTFHATCARILRRESLALGGWDANFVIYDTDDQLALMRRALRDLNLDEKKYKPASILSIVSRCKNALIAPQDFQPATYFEEVARRAYERYQELLRDNNAMDFDDLIMQTVELFRTHPDILQAYRTRLQHILVDEFQDTNLAQYVLLKLLAGPQPCLFVVADEDQSIYSWRGADYRNVLRFREDFPQHRLILLEQNYRSTATILEAAKHVIRRNRRRVDKDLFTQRGPGVRIRVVEAYDEYAEAQFVVDEIARLQAAGEATANQCAIMYRTNAQSRVLEEEFIRRGMPYQLVRGTRFYERKEIKDALAYLRLIHNPHDSVSLVRVINTPARGIGAQTVAQLEHWAFQLGVSMFDALLVLRAEAREARPAAIPAPFSARARSALLRFTELLLELRAARLEFGLPELYDLMLRQTGYRDMIQDGTREGEERWENLMELRAVTQEFAFLPPEEALPLFLEQVALVSDADSLNNAAAGAILLTLHAAKGLEFPVVFIVGMNEYVLPHARSLDDPEAMEEERRLCYVGITRARDRLYLVHTSRRGSLGQSGPCDPSRFLQDIPEALIERRSGYGEDALEALVAQGGHPLSATDGAAASRHGFERAISMTGSVPSSQAPSVRQPRFRAGDVVWHPKFGEGVVLASRLTHDDEEIQVSFGERGVKWLSVALAPLTKREGTP